MKKTFLLLTLILSIVSSRSQNLPDLKTGVSFSYGYDQINKEVNLTWDFFNVGGAATNSFVIAYIATQDMNIGPEDYLIGTKGYASAVANAFATVTFTYGFAPGDLPSGLYNFVVYIDYGNAVAESNESNNIVSFGTFNFVGATAVNQHSGVLTDIRLFPNPATNFVNLQLNRSGNMGSLKYTLTDTEGREAQTGLISESFDASEDIAIPLDNLNKGFYFFRLEADGKTLVRKKLVVN